MFSRRALLAFSAAIPALFSLPAKACEHKWACIGVIGHKDHYHHVCLHCRAEVIEVHNVWTGEKTREGMWSVRDYRRTFGYEPERRLLQARRELVLGQRELALDFA